MNKIVPILLIGILILSGSGALAFPYNNQKERYSTETSIKSNSFMSDDVLDQSQTEYETVLELGGVDGQNYMFAQSFIPQKSILTRVEIYIARVGSPNPFILAIRSDVAGENLTMVTVSADHIPSGYYPDWVEFDFNDIPVSVGSTYYIIAATTVKYNTIYALGLSMSNPYLNGTMYAGVNWQYWSPQENSDMCFKTYGKDLPLHIGDVTGGFGKVCTTVTNNFGADVTNVNWNVSIEGGIFQGIQVQSGGTITTLEGNTSEQVCTDKFIMGFGPIQITISAELETGEKVIKNVDGFVFFLLVIIK